MARPKLRALLVDLSGTLHIGPNAIAGAVEALQRARNAGLAIRFCSNASKECTADLRARLIKSGFEIRDGELWTSLGALKDLVKVRKLKRPYFLLSDSAKSEFSEYIQDNGSSSSDIHHAEFDSVVVGLAAELFDYAHLTKAFRILSNVMQRREAASTSTSSNSALQQTSNGDAESQASTGSEGMGSPLIATHRARYIRTPDGELSLGPGPFVTALEDAVGRGLRAEAVGKPSRAFFERVLWSLSDSRREGAPLSKDRDNSFAASEDSATEVVNGRGSRREAPLGEGVALIGDDVDADLGGAASEVGLWRVLVKTGKYQPGDEAREGLRPPDEIQESFATFIESLVGPGKSAQA